MVSKYLQKLRLVISHILLYSATIIYIIFGAVVFHKLELPFEIEHLEKHSRDIFEAQVRGNLFKLLLIIWRIFLRYFVKLLFLIFLFYNSKLYIKFEKSCN